MLFVTCGKLLTLFIFNKVVDHCEKLKLQYYNMFLIAYYYSYKITNLTIHFFVQLKL